MNDNNWTTEILRGWLAKVDDETLLDEWANAIAERRARVVEAKTLPEATLLSGLRECKDGDVLYFGRPLNGDVRVAFVEFQPRVKRLWFRTKEGRTKYISLDNINKYQPSRTEPRVRARAMAVGP